MGGLYGEAAEVPAQAAGLTGGEVLVAVYGLGKMGLPLAAVFADVTGLTVGVDVDPAVVERVNDGESPVEREPGLQSLVADVVHRGALRASTDGEAVAAAAEVHVVIVPTLLDDANEPDLSPLEAVTETIGEGLSPGDTVLVESTVPPRTTADVVVPHLATRSGLGADEFGAAACPERTVSGQALADIRGTHPKVVGGVDDESTRVARLVYEQVTDNDVVTAPNATTAEAVKVFEGVYRDVNIALANELARLAPEVHLDVRTAIDLANTQPFCDIHDPGPGVGGHCIPVYPYFLAGTVDETTPVMTASREVNDAMPAHTAEMTGAVLAAHGVSLPDATVLLLGVTYKADVAELRNAPALHLARMLDDRGVTVRAADPLVDEWGELAGVEPVSAEAASDLEVDAVVLVTPHAEFREYDYEAFDAPILDGRDAVDAAAVDAPVYPLGGRWP